MSRVSVKKRMIGATMNDKSLNEQFAQMLGGGDIVDMNIIYPKYRDLYISCKNILNAFAHFHRDMIGGHAEIKKSEYYVEMGEFVKSLIGEFKNTFTFKLLEEKIDCMFDHMSNDEKKEFGKVYKMSKESALIKKCIVFCKNITKYKKYLFNNADHTSESSSFVRNGSFITTMTILKVTPFEPSLKIDFRYLCIKYSLNNEMKKLIADLMADVYCAGHSIYKIIISPDIDVDAFVDKLMSQITAIKKEIPRCSGAFSRIEKATSMLKNNFTDYYKAFVTSKDPNTILQSFIIDVSQQDGVDAKTAAEFSHILAFLRKKSQKINDPKADKIMDKLGEHISMLEELMGGSKSTINVDDPTDESSSSSSYVDENERAKAILERLNNSDVGSTLPGLSEMMNPQKMQEVKDFEFEMTKDHDNDDQSDLNDDQKSENN